MLINTENAHSSLLSNYRVAKRLLGAVSRRFREQWFTKLLEQDIEYRTYFVSPHNISFLCSKKFFPSPNPRVIDGDWDELRLTFNDLDIYQSFASVVQKKCNWSETPLFQRMLREMESARHKRVCRSEKEILSQLQYFESIYNDMRELGYINKHNYDQISVAVGRHGDLLLNNGRVRLAIAKLLGIPHVPVTIVARHPEWVKFKRQILKFALRQSNRKIYATLLHPDLENIPANHGHKRFELIRRKLISKSGTLLDIGCHWGYFCHRFEEIGFQCTGIEHDSENFYFLEKIRRACNKKFEVVNQSAFDYLPLTKNKYDVVLALAIFHHFVKSQDGFERLKKLLADLQMREMYFLPHHQSESQMREAYWNPSEAEFIDFILQNSRLTNVVHIGYAMDGRSLYQLT